MSSLSVFIGNLTHEDSPDGYEECVIISEDISPEKREEALEGQEESAVRTLSREQMNLLAKSIDESRDTFGLGDGYRLDLADSYILGWDN